MDSGDDDNYLQRITEMIYDDNAIVTCTILSKILNINIRKAQDLLDKYVENADVPEQTDVSWTYIVIGINADEGFSVILLKDKEVDKKGDVLKNVISQHVYSVQRNNVIDLAVLANVEPFNEHNIRSEPIPGSIVSSNAIIRKLKSAPNEIKRDSKTSDIKENEVFENTNKAKKSNIENFCTKGNIQINNLKPTTTIKSKQKSLMANFFSKSATKVNGSDENTSKELNKDKDNDNLDNSPEGKTMETDNEFETKVEEIPTDNTDINKTGQNTAKCEKKSKKRRSESKSNQPSKKRKRIIESKDSDSDIFASSESEIEVLPDINYSDDNYCEEEKPIEPTLPGKIRRMKQITEEFMDEEGYMNTVQRYVMVSDEDEENKEQNSMNTIKEKAKHEKPDIKNEDVFPISSKKEVSQKKNKNSKGKPTTKAGQNQMSIMNFFKKA